MEYREFVETVKNRVEEILGSEYSIRINTVMKNNRRPIDSMAILKRGENASPAIYLELYYQKFLSGDSMAQVVLQILDFYRENRVTQMIDVTFLEDFSKVRGQIICKLVNCSRNSLMLEHVPHRHFMDLAIIYYIDMEHTALGCGGVRVLNSHLEMWGIQEEELYEAATENTGKYMKHRLVQLSDLIEEMTGIRIGPEQGGDSPMYVLTNEKRCFGAAVITFPHVLDLVAQRIQDDFFILPSSIHECMILPVHCTEGKSVPELRRMVCEINHSQVQEDEILGDMIYRYCASEKVLCLASDSLGECGGNSEEVEYSR